MAVSATTAIESATDSAAAADLELQSRAEQVRQICRMMPISISMSLVLAAVAAGVLWDSMSHFAIASWLGALVAVSTMRLRTYRQLTRIPERDHVGVLALAPSVRNGSLAAGLAWGVSVPLLYHPANLELQLFLVFVLAGVTAGGATSLSADRQVALRFQLPILLPMALRLAIEAEVVHVGMAAMVVLYAAFMAATVVRVSGQHLENIGLRLQALQRERQLFESHSRYRQLAHHDALTGLPNRYSLQTILPTLLRSAADADTPLALLYLDLDDFKDINDTRGHGHGDRVLVEVADRLRHCARDDDLVVRMGGDEFIVVTRRAASRADLEQHAARICDSLSAPIRLGDDTVNTSACIGIGLFPDHGSDAAMLMQHADIALYQAKLGGRGSQRFFTATMSAAIAERMNLEGALLQALDGQQIYVEYQPIVSLPDGTITGFEALARWHHPERGIISPATFIAIAERCGHIERLGEIVLSLVIRQLKAWQDEMVPTVPVAVNVSPRQFERDGMAQLVARLTGEMGIDPSLLQVEITESLIMSQSQASLATLGALRRLGTRVAIDDFGTGYSSLGYLKHLPIDAVKIDRCFVRDMQNDERDATIVSAIVNIAHSLGLRVIAEGVETVQQAQRLAALGCDAAQGYHFHKPLPAGRCRELLEQQARAHSGSETLRMRILRWMQPPTQRSA